MTLLVLLTLLDTELLLVMVLFESGPVWLIEPWLEPLSHPALGVPVEPPPLFTDIEAEAVLALLESPDVALPAVVLWLALALPL